MDKSADAFRTISEVADDLELPPHVLRFWETKFPAINPMKRAGGRRYYRPADVEILRSIRRLLYEDGYTIKGVQRLFKERGDGGDILPARDERVDGADMAAAITGDSDAAIDGQPAMPTGSPPAVARAEPAEPAGPEADGKPALQTEAVLSVLELLDECEDILARSRTGR